MKARCSLGEERSEKEGLIVHPGEGDNIRCLKAATSNPVISWTRIMKTEKWYLLEEGELIWMPATSMFVIAKRSTD